MLGALVQTYEWVAHHHTVYGRPTQHSGWYFVALTLMQVTLPVWQGCSDMYKIFKAYCSSVHIEVVCWCGCLHCSMGVLLRTSSVSIVPHLIWIKMHIRQRNIVSMYVTRVGKVVASCSVGLRQSSSAVLVVVGWQLLAPWSTIAWYTVSYQNTAACLLPVISGH